MTLSLASSKSRHGDPILAQLGGVQGRLVDQIFEIRTGKTGRAAGQDLKIDFRGKRSLARVHFEDALAALEIGIGNHDLTVETARAQQCGIQNIRAVGGGDEDDALVGFKPVHFDQHGVEGLLTLVMPAAQTGAALTAHGVDFIDKDEAKGAFFLP